MRYYLLMTVAMFLLSGCAMMDCDELDGWGEIKETPKAMSGYEAIRIAYGESKAEGPKDEHVPLDWNADYVGYMIEARYIADEDCWWVTRTSLPAAPDFYMTIQVDKDGKAEVVYPYPLPDFSKENILEEK
ncbi:hypothetical protein JD969_11265 [Planctomycetota bacterium]|nr:hypothetical protein JD969_11265 [Planctomycetota bacterium]